MGWALPGCNVNCPSNWISDGYCDKACNTSECDYDGGDCDRSAKNGTGGQSPYDNARLAFINQSHQVTPGFYCSTGCSTSWLADKYCDHACNNKNCAYDLADCGVANFQDLYGISLTDSSEDLKNIELPTQTLAFYVNFTNILGNDSSEFDVVKAEHEEIDIVRKMSVVNKFRLLTVLLMPDAYSENVTQNAAHTFRVYVKIKPKNAAETDKVYKISLLVRPNAFLKQDMTRAPEKITNNGTTLRNRTLKKPAVDPANRLG